MYLYFENLFSQSQTSFSKILLLVDYNCRVYCKYSNKFSYLIRKAKYEHFVELFENAPSKNIWSTLKSSGIMDSESNSDVEITPDQLNDFFIANSGNVSLITC